MVRQFSQQKRILVIGAEDIFLEFIQQFPAERYRLDFAGDAQEADARRRDGPPDLLIVPWAAVAEVPPRCLVRARAAHRPVLALYPGLPPPKDDWPAALVDRVVDRADWEAAAGVARALLAERRQRPRATLELAVSLGPHGRAQLLDISAHSVLISTDAPLAVGEKIPLVADCGRERVETEATVHRLLPGQPPQVVLTIAAGDPATVILDRTVRRALALEHFDHLDPGLGYVQGPVAWQVTRDADRARKRIQAGPETSAGEDAPAASVGGLEERYRLGARLGRWGVGEVFQARQRLRNRWVLVKRLALELRSNQAARARLELEARAGSALADIPGVAAVLDFGSDGEGGLYYTMEPLEGIRLLDALQTGQRFGPQETARLGAQLAISLVQASRRGFHHGDLCPGTIFLQRTEGGTLRPLLLGFTDGFIAEDSPDPGPADDAPGAESRRDAKALCALLQQTLDRDGGSGAMADPAERACADLREILRRGAPGSTDGPEALEELTTALLRCTALLDRVSTEPPPLLEAPAALLTLKCRSTLPSLLGAVLTEQACAAVDGLGTVELETEGDVAATAPPAEPARRHRVASVSSLALVLVATTLLLASPGPRGPTADADAGAAGAAEVAGAPDPPGHRTPGTTEPARSDPSEDPLDEYPLGADKALHDSKPPNSAKRRRAASRKRRGYLRLARWLLDHDRGPRARYYLTKALRYGDGAALRGLLARTYSDEGQPGVAVEHLKKAIRLAPRSPQYRESLGLLYLTLGKRWRACETFRSARALTGRRASAAALQREHCPRSTPRSKLLSL